MSSYINYLLTCRVGNFNNNDDDDDDDDDDDANVCYSTDNMAHHCK